jgi:protein-disulfide isomerase
MSKLSVAVNAQDHAQGNPDALWTLVEYGDYECPHCGAAYPIVKRLQEKLGDKLLFVFRNFPLQEMHPHAEHAAEAAEFAGESELFWQMHDLLFENQQSLEDEFLLQFADELGLSQHKLSRSLRQRTYRDRVASDFRGGVRSGVNGTPTFSLTAGAAKALINSTIS